MGKITESIDRMLRSGRARQERLDEEAAYIDEGLHVQVIDKSTNKQIEDIRGDRQMYGRKKLEYGPDKYLVQLVDERHNRTLVSNQPGGSRPDTSQSAGAVTEYAQMGLPGINPDPTYLLKLDYYEAAEYFQDAQGWRVVITPYADKMIAARDWAAFGKDMEDEYATAEWRQGPQEVVFTLQNVKPGTREWKDALDGLRFTARNHNLTPIMDTVSHRLIETITSDEPYADAISTHKVDAWTRRVIATMRPMMTRGSGEPYDDDFDFYDALQDAIRRVRVPRVFQSVIYSKLTAIGPTSDVWESTIEEAGLARIDRIYVTVGGIGMRHPDYEELLALAQSMGMLKSPTGAKEGIEFMFKHLRQGENFVQEVTAKGLRTKLEASGGAQSYLIKDFDEPLSRRTKSLGDIMGEATNEYVTGGTDQKLVLKQISRDGQIDLSLMPAEQSSIFEYVIFDPKSKRYWTGATWMAEYEFAVHFNHPTYAEEDLAYLLRQWGIQGEVFLVTEEPLAMLSERNPNVEDVVRQTVPDLVSSNRTEAAVAFRTLKSLGTAAVPYLQEYLGTEYGGDVSFVIKSIQYKGESTNEGNYNFTAGADLDKFALFKPMQIVATKSEGVPLRIIRPERAIVPSAGADEYRVTYGPQEGKRKASELRPMSRREFEGKVQKLESRLASLQGSRAKDAELRLYYWQGWLEDGRFAESTQTEARFDNPTVMFAKANDDLYLVSIGFAVYAISADGTQVKDLGNALNLNRAANDVFQHLLQLHQVPDAVLKASKGLPAREHNESVQEATLEERRNEDVIKMFLGGEFPEDKRPVWGTKNLRITRRTNGWSLVNYSTPLLYHKGNPSDASWLGRPFDFNTKKYSVSTSTIQNKIKAIASQNGIKLNAVDAKDMPPDSFIMGGSEYNESINEVFSHSFSPDFYGDPYDARKSRKPTNLADALASMDDKRWEEMAQDVFGAGSGIHLGLETVWSHAIETDTVSDLRSPVEVWIDKDGYYTVDVYDEFDESIQEAYKPRMPDNLAIHPDVYYVEANIEVNPDVYDNFHQNALSRMEDNANGFRHSATGDIDFEVDGIDIGPEYADIGFWVYSSNASADDAEAEVGEALSLWFLPGASASIYSRDQAAIFTGDYKIVKVTSYRVDGQSVNESVDPTHPEAHDAPLSEGVLSSIRPGDRVTIKGRDRQKRTGKAVMRNRATGAWVLNMGGRHGTTAIATEDNIVKVKPTKHKDSLAMRRLMGTYESINEAAQAYNVFRTPLDQALEYSDGAMEAAGKQLDVELPDFDSNYLAMQSKRHFVKNIPRILMPVIEPSDIKAFEASLAQGHIDIFRPEALTHLQSKFPDRFSNRSDAHDWLTLGIQDGDPNDDVLKARITRVEASELKPLQDEIWLTNIIPNIIKFGVPQQGSPVTEATLIISQDNYIIDGHHRTAQAWLGDPRLKMKVLEVPLGIDDLLEVARSYGAALGNKPKA